MALASPFGSREYCTAPLWFSTFLRWVPLCSSCSFKLWLEEVSGSCSLRQQASQGAQTPDLSALSGWWGNINRAGGCQHPRPRESSSRSPWVCLVDLVVFFNCRSFLCPGTNESAYGSSVLRFGVLEVGVPSCYHASVSPATF